MVSAPHAPVCCPDISGSDGVTGGIPVSLLQPALHRLRLQAHLGPGLGCPQVPMYPLCGDTAVSSQAQLRCRVRSRHKGDRGGITAQNPTQLIPLHRIKADISHYQPGKNLPLRGRLKTADLLHCKHATVYHPLCRADTSPAS